MALFEVARKELNPFRRLNGGADLYEKQLEEMLQANLEESPMRPPSPLLVK